MDEDIIKCVGINEVGMHPQQFYMAFAAYCSQEGQVEQIRVSNNVAAAIVRKRT